jgi:hypothetical protein
MYTVLYWFGVVHAVAYGLAGAAFVLIYAVFWVHWKAKLLRPIMEWYIAKRRWDDRHTHGLKDAEWERGEPKP